MGTIIISPSVDNAARCRTLPRLPSEIVEVHGTGVSFMNLGT
jgi:hypothetical protein